MAMHLVEVITYIVKDSRIVGRLEHFAEDGGNGSIVRGTLERTGICQKTQDRSGARLSAYIFKVFPFGIETDDGFEDRIISAAIELALRQMVLREVVEETVALLRGTGVVLIALGREEEALEAGVGFGSYVLIR